MNTRNKIIVDRIIGVLVAHPLNYLVRFIGFLTRFDHSLKSEKKRIIVSKYKGMGSIIQSTPLLKALKAKYPNAKLVYVSSIENRGILERIELIDEVLLLNDTSFFKLLGSTIALIFRLLRKRGDLFIDLEIYSNFSSVLTTSSLAKDRFGFYLTSSKFRLGLYTHMMYFNTTAPISQAYLQFARLLNCDETQQVQYEFKKQNAIFKVDGPYVVINVNASDLRLERRWEVNSFVELIREVRKRYSDLKVVLIGAKNEVEYVWQVSEHFVDDEMVIDVSGKTSFDELIECIRNSEFVITNDTGPMHLASALKKKTIALFGPCSPAQYASSDHLHAIYINVYCSPCVHEFLIPPCKGDNQCMKLIEVSSVLRKVIEVYENNLEVKVLSTKVYEDANNGVLGKVVRG